MPGALARRDGTALPGAPPRLDRIILADNAFAPFADFRAFRDSDLGRWLDARPSAEPEQADVVHDILAHLAGRMIEMHKEKQAEVRGFLDWLAGYTGLPVDDWVLKTNLRHYHEHDWAEMRRILKRNQRKLPRVDLDVEAYKNEPAAKVRAAWETSMDTLRPLLASRPGWCAGPTSCGATWARWRWWP